MLCPREQTAKELAPQPQAELQHAAGQHIITVVSLAALQTRR